MKRNLRFYFALMFARGTALVLKLIGRKGMKVTTIILLVILFSMVCSAFGILA